MRLAIFSDVHGNHEALEAILTDAGLQGVDRYICLGDMVGYGASPNECVERVRALKEISYVLGNHDEAALATGPCNMRRVATHAILWTRDTLTDENTRFLAAAPPTLFIENAVFAHGTPYRPLDWHYVHTREFAARSFSIIPGRLGFVGHTHVPCIVTRRNLFFIRFEEPEVGREIHIDDGKSRLVGCGSVGQPRDGDPRASYVLYDSQRATLIFRRIAYNAEIAAAKILAAGLPEALAHRLGKGI